MGVRVCAGVCVRLTVVIKIDAHKLCHSAVQLFKASTRTSSAAQRRKIVWQVDGKVANLFVSHKSGVSIWATAKDGDQDGGEGEGTLAWVATNLMASN